MKSAHLLTVLTLFLVSCAPSRPPVPPGIIPAPKSVAVEDEQYGHNVLTTLNKQFELDFDHPRYDEVIDVVERLTKGINADNQPWHVHVFKHDTFTNAAATRGNHIFIWTAMIDATKSKGELAAILSHEIAHVLAGHTEPDPQAEINRMLIGLGALAAGIAVTAVTSDPTIGSNLGRLTSSVTEQVGAGIFTNPYSRNLELDADQIGLMIMAKSGFNPNESISFWKRATQDPNFSKSTEFFSTHPVAAQRLVKLEELLPKAMEVYRNPSSLAIGRPETPHKPSNASSKQTRSNSSQRFMKTSGVQNWRTVETATIYDSPTGSIKIGTLPARTDMKVIGTLRGWIEITSPQSGFIQGRTAEPIN